MGFDYLNHNIDWDDDIETNPARLLTQEEKDFIEKDLTEKLRKKKEKQNNKNELI